MEQYDEINILDYFQVLVKRRRMILGLVLGVMILTAVISLILPKTYRATATLLPPEQPQGLGLETMLAKTPLPSLGIPRPSKTADVFVQILKSRTVARGVIGKLNLMKIWGIDSFEKAREKLADISSISASEEGIVTIRVEARSPQLAAAIANTYIQELDRVNKEKSSSRAKIARIYIEKQLKRTEESLKRASEALAEFQQENKAVSLEEQMKVAIEKAGEIKGKIMAKEVELGVLLQTMKETNPQVRAIRSEIEELQKQYRQLQYGNGQSLSEQNEFYIPFSEAPEVSRKLAELIREVKIQETVYELLNQQYYQAKIEEAKDTPTVQVLDEAVPPERKYKPKRKLMILVAGSLTLFCSILIAFFLEYLERLKQKDQNDYQKIERMWHDIKEDLLKVKRIFRREDD